MMLDQQHAPTACTENTQPLSLEAPKPKNKTRPMVKKAVLQAIDIQAQLLADIKNPQTTAMVRSHCARAWCTVQECIRVMRGIPAPGQLRPDLDPVQLAKALKRSRARVDRSVIHDVASAIIHESDEEKPGESKESL